MINVHRRDRRNRLVHRKERRERVLELCTLEGQEVQNGNIAH